MYPSKSFLNQKPSWHSSRTSFGHFHSPSPKARVTYTIVELAYHVLKFKMLTRRVLTANPNTLPVFTLITFFSPGCSFLTLSSSLGLNPVWSSLSAVETYLPVSGSADPSTARESPTHATRKREVLGSNMESRQQEPAYPGASKERASVCVLAVFKAVMPEARISASSCLKEAIMAFSTASFASREDG